MQVIMQKNFDRVLVLSFGFLLLFTAFSTSQILAARVLQENDFGNLGFYSLSVLYLTFSLTNFFALSIVSRLGVKCSLVLGSLGYAFYVGAFILPAYRSEYSDQTGFFMSKGFIQGFILVAAFLNGFGASILWVSQGKYVTECANDSNKGTFNSVFWALFMVPEIIGNLMAAFVIQSLNETVFYSIEFAISICASLFFLILKKPLPQDTEDGLEESRKSEAQVKSVKEDIKETFAMLVNPRMLPVLPLISCVGLSMVIYGSLFVPMFTDNMPADWEDKKKDQQALLATLWIGVGEILGSIAFGRVMDRLSEKKAIVVNFIFMTTAFAVLLAYVIHYEFNLVFASALSFLYGIQDAGLNTYLKAILGFQFESKTTPFSVFGLVQAFSVFVFLIVESFIKTQFQLKVWFSVVFVYLAVSWITFATSFKFRPVDPKQQQLLNVSAGPSESRGSEIPLKSF